MIPAAAPAASARQARRYPGFVIDPLRTCDQWTVGEALDNPIVTEQETDSPLMTHVRLDNVLMPEAKKLDFKPEHQVLASSVGGEPLYCSLERDEGKLLVLTVNLAKGDLPLRTAFPIMMTNALNWYQDSRGELREATSAGGLVEVDLAPLLSDEMPAGCELSFRLLALFWQPIRSAAVTAHTSLAGRCFVIDLCPRGRIRSGMRAMGNPLSSEPSTQLVGREHQQGASGKGGWHAPRVRCPRDTEQNRQRRNGGQPWAPPAHVPR